MNVKDTAKAIKALGPSCRRQDGEWRINIAPYREETAYYTDDADDALATAQRMVAGA